MDSFNLAKIVSNYSTNVASLLCVVSIPHSLRPQKLWFYFLFIQGSDFIFPMPSTLFVQVHTLTTKFHNFLTNWFPSFLDKTSVLHSNMGTGPPSKIWRGKAPKGKEIWEWRKKWGRGDCALSFHSLPNGAGQGWWEGKKPRINWWRQVAVFRPNALIC